MEGKIIMCKGVWAMLVNQSVKASLDKSLQLLVLSAISIGLLSIGPTSAQAPVTATTPAASATTPPSTPTAPATPATPATPAQVAPATQSAPAKNADQRNIKPGVNIYNGTNASTLEFPNSNPALKK